MQKEYEQVELIELPESFEQLIGYDSEREYRWVAIYFDPTATETQAPKGEKKNVIHAIEREIEVAKGDLKKHKLKKMITKINDVKSKTTKVDYRECNRFEDNENPWRIADHMLDSGAFQNGCSLILDNQRIQEALDKFYEIEPGTFFADFMKSKTMFLFDREKLKLYAGGSSILDVVEDVNWKINKKRHSYATVNENKKDLKLALIKNQIFIENRGGNPSKKRHQSNVIEIKQFKLK